MTPADEATGKQDRRWEEERERREAGGQWADPVSVVWHQRGVSEGRAGSFHLFLLNGCT